MTDTFTQLILNHGFEQRYGHHLSGLEESGVMCRLAYTHPDENSYLIIDLKNRQIMTRVTLWETGDCEIDTVSFKDSSVISEESFKLNTLEEYEEKLVGLISHMKETINPQ